MLKTFCLFLKDQRMNQAKENWHVKEELLNLVTHVFLQVFDLKEDWYEEAFKREIEGDSVDYVRLYDQ